MVYPYFFIEFTVKICTANAKRGMKGTAQFWMTAAIFVLLYLDANIKMSSLF